MVSTAKTIYVIQILYMYTDISVPNVLYLHVQYICKWPISFSSHSLSTHWFHNIGSGPYMCEEHAATCMHTREVQNIDTNVGKHVFYKASINIQ